MKIVAWNIRGIGQSDFLSQVKKLVKKFEPNILFLLKKKLMLVDHLIFCLNFNLNVLTLLILWVFFEGLWLCWNSSVVSLNIIVKNNIMFHCMAYFSHLNINCFITFLYGYLQHHKQKRVMGNFIRYQKLFCWALGHYG